MTNESEELTGVAVRIIPEKVARLDVVGGQETEITGQYFLKGVGMKYEMDVTVTYSNEIKTTALFREQFEIIEQDEEEQLRSREKRIAEGQRDRIYPRI